MAEMTPEQAQAMQEKLKNMSPEELKEFQKQQCIFCQIIAGKVASKKIYSDDKCTALLDINPANPGHILLLPNEHYSIMPLIPQEDLKHIFMVAKALAHASLKALEAQGTNIFIANGVAAGQKAQHFMLHIIPRKEGDDVNIDIPENNISEQDMKKVIDRLRPAIIKALGEEPVSEEPQEGSGEEKSEQIKKPEEYETDDDAEEQAEEEDTDEEETGEETEKTEEPDEEDDETDDQEKFITSENARRFHKNECPFAQKIPEEKRIYVNLEEAEELEKLPCSCTKIEEKEEAEETDEPEEDTDEEETDDDSEEQAEEENTDEEDKEERSEVSLDDISSLLTGGN